jgi:hypothetical protein
MSDTRAARIRTARTPSRTLPLLAMALRSAIAVMVATQCECISCCVPLRARALRRAPARCLTDEAAQKAAQCLTDQAVADMARISEVDERHALLSAPGQPDPLTTFGAATRPTSSPAILIVVSADFPNADALDLRPVGGDADLSSVAAPLTARRPEPDLAGAASCIVDAELAVLHFEKAARRCHERLWQQLEARRSHARLWRELADIERPIPRRVSFKRPALAWLALFPGLLLAAGVASGRGGERLCRQVRAVLRQSRHLSAASGTGSGDACAFRSHGRYPGKAIAFRQPAGLAVRWNRAVAVGGNGGSSSLARSRHRPDQSRAGMLTWSRTVRLCVLNEPCNRLPRGGHRLAYWPSPSTTRTTLCAITD